MLLRWPANLVRGLSLADKCLILFGGTVVLIVASALTFPWLRMQSLVDAGELEFSTYLADVQEAREAERPLHEPTLGDHASLDAKAPDPPGMTARRLTPEEARNPATGSPQLARELERFEADPMKRHSQRVIRTEAGRTYRYLRPHREGGLVNSLLVIERPSPNAGRLIVVNTLYILSAASFVLGLAILVFYLITHRIILAPVRELTGTAERVRQGDADARSDIQTGDEFEVLAETFNEMLETLSSANERLRGSNAAMDVKISELAEANLRLYEAMSLKSEFLASVSHELRTPLNAIIGFAELLLAIADRDDQLDEPPGQASLAKRKRYLDNIVSAGRNLLDMIEDLLEMAKIEAGRVSVEVNPVEPRDLCEGLMGLIYPLAERAGIRARMEIDDRLPMLRTDPRKLRQIVFNLLANAIKFTGEIGSDGRPGEVLLRAERLPDTDPHGIERVRFSVIDNGPGIATEEHEAVFEKFRQIDASHTRGHAGTGLGLAIAREFSQLLQGELRLESDLGEGAMFTLVIPVELDTTRIAEQALESRFRATLSPRRANADDPVPDATSPEPDPALQPDSPPAG